MPEKIKDKKIDFLLKTLVKNEYPYLIANEKILKIMYPDIPWTSGMIMTMDDGLKIFCTDAEEDGKIYTNLNIEWDDIE